jgi:capsular exopolysaccharide synthesis family protein
MEEIDLKIVLRKIIKKWYWFLISLTFFLTGSLIYLAVAKKEYLVEATIQLKDQGLADKGSSKEKFLVGLELLDTNSELEDEIGILTSYSLIQESLEILDFEVSIYEYPTKYSFFNDFISKEVYPSPFEIQFDYTNWQILNTPINITFIDKEKYRIQVSSSKSPLKLYNLTTKDVKSIEKEIKIDTILSISQVLELPYLKFKLGEVDPLIFESDLSYTVKIKNINDLKENYKENLSSSKISEKSNIVKLSLKGVVPKKEILFLNTLSELYIQNDLKKKNRLGERTVEFIEFQLQGVTDSLRNTESSLESFRSQNQIIDVGATSQNLTNQLFSLEEKQAQLSVQSQYFNYILDYLLRNDDVTDIISPSSVGIADNHLNSMIMQLSNLSSEKISKGFSSNSNAPVIQVLDKKIESTKKALIDNVNNLINSTQISINENNRRINEIKQGMRKLPTNERNLKDIQRKFALNDNIYNYLLQKRADAGIAIASNVADKSLVDFPQQIGKAPVKPNKLLILTLAIVLGFVVPGGFIFLGEFFQSKVESEEELLSWTSIPIVKSVSLLSEKEKKFATSKEGYLAHAFRYIRLHLDFLQKTKNVKVVGVTSTVSGEGKTFSSLNIALSFAFSGKKTLLIDADLHKPNLHQILNVKEKPGLAEYLLKIDKPSILKTKVPGLDFLPAGESNENPSDLIAISDISSLMDSLKEQYDIIIVDTAPLGLVADYLVLNKFIDYTFLVVRQDVSEKNDLKRLDNLLNQHQIVSGIIYNGANSGKSYNGYYKYTKGKNA